MEIISQYKLHKNDFFPQESVFCQARAMRAIAWSHLELFMWECYWSMKELSTFCSVPKERTINKECSTHLLSLQFSSSLPSLQSSSPSHRNVLGIHCPFLHSTRPWLRQARKFPRKSHFISLYCFLSIDYINNPIYLASPK